MKRRAIRRMLRGIWRLGGRLVELYRARTCAQQAAGGGNRLRAPEAGGFGVWVNGMEEEA